LFCSDNDDDDNVAEKQQLSVNIHATSEMCYHCFDVLIHHWLVSSSKKDNDNHDTDPNESSSSFYPPTEFLSTIPTSIHIPLFVTWEIRAEQDDDEHPTTYRLRGCIGTFQARPLCMALGDYAKLAACNDRRFDPISVLELQSLRVSVSLLVHMEPCANWYDWDIGIHGIQIRFSDNDDDDDDNKQDNGPSTTTTTNEKHDTTTIYSATFLPNVAKQQG
jgi:AMME syndrome candidate gene 1 protein